MNYSREIEQSRTNYIYTHISVEQIKNNINCIGRATKRNKLRNEWWASRCNIALAINGIEANISFG